MRMVPISIIYIMRVRINIVDKTTSEKIVNKVNKGKKCGNNYCTVYIICTFEIIIQNFQKNSTKGIDNGRKK